MCVCVCVCVCICVCVCNICLIDCGDNYENSDDDDDYDTGDGRLLVYSKGEIRFGVYMGYRGVQEDGGSWDRR